MRAWKDLCGAHMKIKVKGLPLRALKDRTGAMQAWNTTMFTMIGARIAIARTTNRFARSKSPAINSNANTTAR